MLNQKTLNLLEKIFKDRILTERFLKLETIEEVFSFLQEIDENFTEKDFLKIFEDVLSNSREREKIQLNIKELESVAGGKMSISQKITSALLAFGIGFAPTAGQISTYAADITPGSVLQTEIGKVPEFNANVIKTTDLEKLDPKDIEKFMELMKELGVDVNDPKVSLEDVKIKIEAKKNTEPAKFDYDNALKLMGFIRDIGVTGMTVGAVIFVGYLIKIARGVDKTVSKVRKDYDYIQRQFEVYKDGDTDEDGEVIPLEKIGKPRKGTWLDTFCTQLDPGQAETETEESINAGDGTEEEKAEKVRALKEREANRTLARKLIDAATKSSDPDSLVANINKLLRNAGDAINPQEMDYIKGKLVGMVDKISGALGNSISGSSNISYFLDKEREYVKNNLSGIAVIDNQVDKTQRIVPSKAQIALLFELFKIANNEKIKPNGSDTYGYYKLHKEMIRVMDQASKMEVPADLQDPEEKIAYIYFNFFKQVLRSVHWGIIIDETQRGDYTDSTSRMGGRAYASDFFETFNIVDHLDFASEGENLRVNKIRDIKNWDRIAVKMAALALMDFCSEQSRGHTSSVNLHEGLVEMAKHSRAKEKLPDSCISVETPVGIIKVGAKK